MVITFVDPAGVGWTNLYKFHPKTLEETSPARLAPMGHKLDSDGPTMVKKTSSAGAEGETCRPPHRERERDRGGKKKTYVFTYLDVSENMGTPKSSILIGVFHYFHHPFWGTPIFGNAHLHIYRCHVEPAKKHSSSMFSFLEFMLNIFNKTKICIATRCFDFAQ